MSTLILEVNPEQEKVLETLLAYMDVSYQKVTQSDGWWDSLSPFAQERIEKGLADTASGRYSPAQTVLDQLKSL